MANKIYTIVDINNDHNQNIETLLFANILEKKCNKITVMDLNPYSTKNAFFPLKQCKEKNEIWTTKLFDRTNYIFPSIEALNGLKMLNLATSLVDKNEILLINPNQTKFDFNTPFYKLATELIIFADIKKDISNCLVNFFIKHNMNAKKLHIYAYNFQNNIQDNKAYLSLLSQFKSKKIKIDNINSFGHINSLNKINNIDPWEEIYKKINLSF